MQKRKNLISKKTGIGDHMTADFATDIIFNKAERYLDVINVDGDLGQCIKNQYVSVEWIKEIIKTNEWKHIGKEKALYEYFVNDDSLMKPNLVNDEDTEVMYKRASGDMQFDFDDLNDDIIENIKEAFIIVAKKSPYYRWFEYSWSHCKQHELSGCHIRIYVKLFMKTKIEWGFYYIHLLNSIIKYVDEKYRDKVINHIDWSCCTVTRGYAIPYNEGGVIENIWHDEDEIQIIENEDLLDKKFKQVNALWYDELYNKFMKSFVTPKKKEELKKLGLATDNDKWKYRYSMEEDWIFNENHPMVDGEVYNYNWRLSLVTTLMGVFNNDKDIVRKICAVIYKYIKPYKNHDYNEMLYNELEKKIFNRADFSLEPSHTILKELWNDWGLKITIRTNIY